MAKNDEGFQRRRPRQARSRATYDSILQAAIEVLARDGAARLTTNRVAERAGVSIGTLYQYFPDKAAILLAAAQQELERAENGFLAPQRRLVEALVEMIETLLRRRGTARQSRRALPPQDPGKSSQGGGCERRLLVWLTVPACS